MTEEGQTATKKTVTTTATAVPVGSADDGEVTAPLCLIISVVVLDAIALFFKILQFFLSPLGFIGLVCAIIACILACVIPCQDADKEFGRSINTLMYVHIAFGACYIVTIALWYSVRGTATLVFLILNFALLLAGLVLASILLHKIKAKRSTK